MLVKKIIDIGGGYAVLLLAFLMPTLAMSQDAVSNMTESIKDSIVIKHNAVLLLTNAEIVAEPGINELLHKSIEVNRKPIEQGYRLQIYSGTNRGEAYSLQVEFALKYPTLDCYLTYTQPNYRLRVGDFASRADAEKVKKMIEKDNEFDIAFIVSDKVNPDKIYEEIEIQ
jgi:hypothetical protein